MTRLWVALSGVVLCTAAQTTAPYQQGQVYAARDVVALDGGRTLAVALPPAAAPASVVTVELTIRGPVGAIGFTYGSPKSTITLSAGEQVLAASSAEFDTKKTTATAGPPTLVSRMRTSADAGTLVLDTNEHPLVLQFELPAGTARDRLRLVLRDLTVGRDQYSLAFDLGR